MSEPLLQWTALAPSRLRQRILLLAGALSLVAAVLLAAAVLTAGGGMQMIGPLLATGIGVLAAAFLLGAWRRSNPWDAQVSVASDGTITVRVGRQRGPADASLLERFAMVPVVLSPLFLVLAQGRRRVVVWRDSLPAPAFRRLIAAARWRLERRGHDTAAPTA